MANSHTTFAKLSAAIQDRDICKSLIARLDKTLAGRPMRFMEVCGTHTTAIFRSGLRSLLPPSVLHISGPGCPVCVTHESEVGMFLELANCKNLTIATFGDLVRVPGPNGRSLKHAMANGAHVQMVYSPLDAVALAAKEHNFDVVFLGAGFETTVPAVAAAILQAHKSGINNFSVLSMHKLVPPALDALLRDPACQVDAFLLPGHVATITGIDPFSFISNKWHKPAAVGGFEPADILLALCSLAEQISANNPEVANCYARAVDYAGNPRALELVYSIFEPVDAIWRGLGKIPQSGLAVRKEYENYDAIKRYNLKIIDMAPLPGCMCGEILKGNLLPTQCPMFGKKCTPATPVGPCMVSTEGSCAAHYKYGV